MNSYQIAEWEAFNFLDPIGDERQDIHMAILATTIFNLAVDIHGKKGTKHREITDYMPNWGGDETDEGKGKQSVEEMKNILLSMASSQNKKIEKTRTRLKKASKEVIEKPGKDG